MSLVSLKRIISDFNNIHTTSTSDWKTIAINEWLPQALGLMGVRTTFDIGKKSETVSEYRVNLPCNKNYIIAVIYNGLRLPVKRNLPYKYKLDIGYYDLDTYNKIDIYSHIGHTSFETGTIDFIYLDFPRDEDNIIKIPDVEQLHEALRWYLLYMMILSRRYKHPELNLASTMDMWETKAASARNYMTFPSPDKMIEWQTLRNNGLLYDVDLSYFDS